MYIIVSVLSSRELVTPTVPLMRRSLNLLHKIEKENYAMICRVKKMYRIIVRNMLEINRFLLLFENGWSTYSTFLVQETSKKFVFIKSKNFIYIIEWKLYVTLASQFLNYQYLKPIKEAVTNFEPFFRMLRNSLNVYLI